MKNLISKNHFNNPFLSLKHASFRNYWITQGISLIGTWMQNISLPWLAFTITKSPLLLSLVGVFQYMPMLLFSIFAGVIIDKLPKKKILIITQTISMIISFLFYILLFTKNITYWEILTLAVILGFTNTIDMPTRQSFLIDLVGKEDLMNAIGLNSTAFNIARILGPAVAGLIIASFGIELCFLLNTVSYLGVIIVLIFIKPKFHISRNKSINYSIISDIKEGLFYILNDNILFLSLFLVLVVGTFAFNFNVLVPVFAKNVLNQQVSGYGFLMSSIGIGSLIGSLMVSFRSKEGPNRFLLIIMPVIISISLIITGLTNHYVMSAIFIGITGFFLVAFTTTANSTTQINSKHEYRGRVMSIYTLFFAGSTPIGNFFCGIVMKYLGARFGFICCGFAIALFIAFFYIYKNKFIKNFLKYDPLLADKIA